MGTAVRLTSGRSFLASQIGDGKRRQTLPAVSLPVAVIARCWSPARVCYFPRFAVVASTLALAPAVPIAETRYAHRSAS